MTGEHRKGRLRLVLAAGTAAVALVLVLRFVLLLGYVPSASMEPAVPEGSWIVGLRIHRPLEVGDPVIFRREGQLLIKRLAAGPGDTVDWAALTGDSDREPQTVPEGCWVVLGDNGEHSWDSRYWEDPYVREDQVEAVLLLPQVRNGSGLAA